MGDETIVASLEDLQAFDRASPETRKTTPALQGILIEIANTGLLRYDWRYLQTLILHYLDQLILEYDSQSQVEVGPPRPLPGGETPAILRQRLKTQLADQFPSEAPFTIQRLAELLLEPQKHYSRLDKLALALERLMAVTSTLQPSPNPPPRPRLPDLGPVNCNPKPVQMEREREQGEEGHPHPGSGTGEGGYGLASSFLAVNSAGHPEDRPELEEAMGHLNEAGMAANVGAKIPSDPDLPIEVAYTNGHPEPVPQTPEIPPVSPG